MMGMSRAYVTTLRRSNFSQHKSQHKNVVKGVNPLSFAMADDDVRGRVTALTTDD
jgi:hypothetical protein